jgi:hypothetical protein
MYHANRNLSDEIIWTYNFYISHVHDIYWITILNSVYEFVHLPLRSCNFKLGTLYEYSKHDSKDGGNVCNYTTN